MRNRGKTGGASLKISLALGLLACFAVGCSPRFNVDQILKFYEEASQYPESKIKYPLAQTVFPSDIAPCTFSWEDASKADTWVLLMQFDGSTSKVQTITSTNSWMSDSAGWDFIKRRSLETPCRVTILGLRHSEPNKILSRARSVFTTSKDAVEAPIFYREVNLPFLTAVKDPSKIRWRFGAVSSPQQPPVVLENLPVCGNCHSFSADGRTLGMDVDYANNKGSYVISKVSKQMTLASSDVITWDSFRPEDPRQTYGLLSQVSPDGRNILSTVKDRSVFVPRPDLAFSQLFFPIQGVIAVYHRDGGVFESLPGADDPEFVQSNPVWSPDGKYVLFARSKAYQLKNQSSEGKILLSEEDCAEFLRDGKPFLFDICRVPYNEGRGGKAEPLPGASLNGKSNYFPRYSPDGKWIVFCQARSYMLLQPDSELFIVPAEGGEPRRLGCNTVRMNSWHSWSPNGRWLVFSSKANSAYTQLFLTHIDAAGESSPPVLLERFTSADRAANIPEFVNAPPDAIAGISENFLNDSSYARSAYNFETSGEITQAIAEYSKALKLNPGNVHAHQRLGYLLYHVKNDPQNGTAHTLEALRLDPHDACAHFDLGLILSKRGQFDAAIEHLSEAVRLMPKGFDVRYNTVDLHCALAGALLATHKPEQAADVLKRALALAPKGAQAHYMLASALAVQELTGPAVEHYATAVGLDPNVDVSPELHFILSINYEKAALLKEALISAEKALELARKRGDPALLQTVQERRDECRLRALRDRPNDSGLQ